MKTKTIATSLLAALCLSACSSNDDWLTGVKPNNEETAETRHSYTPVQLNETQQAINAKLQEFSWKLFKEVYANRQEGSSLMISPISLGVDLGMFINGLEGETLQEVLKTMGLEGFTKAQINDYFKTMMTGIENADEAATFKSANSFWYNKSKTASKDFLSVIQSNYDAKTEAVDFSDSKTKDLINAWCAENTNGRITKIIEQTEPLDMFHLMNAVYFKARWASPFPKNMTSLMPFHYADGIKKDIAMMRTTQEELYMETNEYQCGVKEFIDGAFLMVFILPKNGVKMIDAIPAIVTKDMVQRYGRIVSLDLYAPKFTSEYTEENLFTYMAKMNPSMKFNPDDMLFFNEPDDDIDMKTLQKTFFLMDEEGAEATAISEVTELLGEAPKEIEHIIMRLDRPFFYAIVEKNTMCPLFIGYYGK